MNRYSSIFLEYLIFMFQPEDSFMGLTGGQDKYLGKQRGIAGTIKAMFWVVIAIAAGLVISRL